MWLILLIIIVWKLVIFNSIFLFVSFLVFHYKILIFYLSLLSWIKYSPILSFFLIFANIVMVIYSIECKVTTTRSALYQWLWLTCSLYGQIIYLILILRFELFIFLWCLWILIIILKIIFLVINRIWLVFTIFNMGFQIN